MKKILVIEDEKAYSTLLQDQLGKTYQISTANNGRKGLDMALADHPDLILLDVKMPIMDGMNMLTELRKNQYGKTAKVIVLTNMEADDSMIQKISDSQPTYYLVKSDVTLEGLQGKIDELLV